MKLFVGTKAVIHHEGKVLLIRESEQYEDGAEVGKWDVPGGRIESNEHVREGLLREVQEETGLIVIANELLGVCDGFPEIKGEQCHVVRIYFLCQCSSNGVVLSKDHDLYDWVDPSNTDGKILMADIEDILKMAQEKI